jgi:hypothetical protein
MAWLTDDVVRSLRRYLVCIVDAPPWKLRLERREVKDEERPVGVVVPGKKSSLRGRTSLIQGNVEDILPITINLYPELPDASEVEDPKRQARLEAYDLADRLFDLFARGAICYTEDKDGHRRHWAGPFRAPLWDYADVPLTGEDRAGPDDPHDVLWIVESSLDVQPIQDTEDPLRWSVIANFRVSIESPGRGPAEDEVGDIDDIVGAFAGEPPADPLDWE